MIDAQGTTMIDAQGTIMIKRIDVARTSRPVRVAKAEEASTVRALVFLLSEGIINSRLVFPVMYEYKTPETINTLGATRWRPIFHL